MFRSGQAAVKGLADALFGALVETARCFSERNTTAPPPPQEAGGFCCGCMSLDRAKSRLGIGSREKPDAPVATGLGQLVGARKSEIPAGGYSRRP
jgi:hypothetical protein